MGKLPLPAPLNVNPTIKLFRWMFLGAGVFYGVSKHAFLAQREVAIKEHERKQKIIRDARIAEERRIASERDIAMLAALGEPAPAEDDKY